MEIHTIVIASLVIAIICFIVIVVDIFAGNLMVMNFVYPITALYAGPLGLLVYYTIGRKSTKKAVMEAKEQNQKPPKKQRPF